MAEFARNGVYKNGRLMHTVTSLIGCLVEVELANGDRHEGIFKTFSPEFDLVLFSAARIINDTPDKRSSTLAANVGNLVSVLEKPNAEEFFTDKFVVKPQDMVKIRALNVDLDYATMSKKSVLTDGEIAKLDSKKVKERELVPWDDDEGNHTFESLEENSNGISNGWDSNDMFNYNEKAYNITSTYKDDMSDYTIQLEKRNDDKYVQKAAQAELIAREIEKDPYRQKRLSKENELDEETRFSAVVTKRDEPNNLPSNISSPRSEMSHSSRDDRLREPQRNNANSDGFRTQNSRQRGNRNRERGSDRGDRGGERMDRGGDRMDRGGDRMDRGGYRGDRRDRGGERGERRDQGDRGGRNDRVDRSDRVDRNDRGDRNDRDDRGVNRGSGVNESNWRKDRGHINPPSRFNPAQPISKVEPKKVEQPVNQAPPSTAAPTSNEVAKHNIEPKKDASPLISVPPVVTPKSNIESKKDHPSPLISSVPHVTPKPNIESKKDSLPLISSAPPVASKPNIEPKKEPSPTISSVPTVAPKPNIESKKEPSPPISSAPPAPPTMAPSQPSPPAPVSTQVSVDDTSSHASTQSNDTKSSAFKLNPNAKSFTPRIAPVPQQQPQQQQYIQTPSQVTVNYQYPPQHLWTTPSSAPMNQYIQIAHPPHLQPQSMHHSQQHQQQAHHLQQHQQQAHQLQHHQQQAHHPQQHQQQAHQMNRNNPYIMPPTYNFAIPQMVSGQYIIPNVPAYSQQSQVASVTGQPIMAGAPQAGHQIMGPAPQAGHQIMGPAPPAGHQIMAAAPQAGHQIPVAYSPAYNI